MIPVLGVPTLTRYDLLDRMLASIDVAIGQLVIVDNGGTYPGDAIRLPHNIGVGAAWNLIIKATPNAPWWALVNDDLEFAPGDLNRLALVMADEAPHLASLDGFSAFGINRAAVELVGFFDENFHPAYVEDCDYEYRCQLAKVPIVRVESSLFHARSSTVTNSHLYEQNGRTHPRNIDYFYAKWGGAPRGGERFQTPFDRGGSVSDWAVPISRLRDLAWETTMLVPAGEIR